MDSITSDRVLCTCCGACENICPAGAITMKPDKEGFLYPYVDQNKCIHCGQCVKVCHNFTPKFGGNKNLDCYAVWASDEIRKKSSAGGVFSLIARYIISENGFVCGASFENNTEVRHIIVEKEQELEKLRTSKYVQSNIGMTYKEIKGLLSDNKMVLFSGTPCQVAGLYLYLGYKPDNLYTVDLLCHGVPSQSLFDRYLSEKYQDEKIKYINFRDKCNGWTYKLKLRVETERNVYISDINEDAYYRAFNERLSLRKSCGTCEFASSERMGDISLGDFWEIWGYDRTLDDRQGTSLVLVNSRKGEFILQKILPEMKKIANVPIERAMKGNVTLYKCLPLHKNRQSFFEDLNSCTLEEAVLQNINKENPNE